MDLLSAGVAVARGQGIEPMQVVRSHLEPRFAFDTEGLIALQEEGFGYFGAREVKYASNGAHGASLIENLMKKYDTKTDVLGILMSETALSMHLKYDDAKGEFYLDLSALEKYQPLPGYAKLGGRALLEERDGRLVTVLLEYGGQSYSGFDDKQSDEDYENKSKLSGWRFAEKAIIASLLAKTQLLMHMKTVHLELAPALQVITIDTLDPSHPLRRLLEPFVSRSIQATEKNLQLWFEFRAGEFGLAPLPMEEQLKLLHETMEGTPLNLADLDLERFAEHRGMTQFSSADRAAGQWTWTWHQRALGFQQKVDKLLDCWFGKHYENSDDVLDSDTDLSVWWKSLVDHMPALRVASAVDKDWVATHTVTTTTTIMTTAPPAPPPSPPPPPVPMASFQPPAAAPAPAPAPGPNFGKPFVPTTEVMSTPSTPKTTTPMQTTPAPVTVTADPPPALVAPGQSTSKAGFFSVLSLHPQTTAAPAKPEKPSEALAKEVPAEAVSLWRRRLSLSSVLEKLGSTSSSEEGLPAAGHASAPAGPVPDVASLKRVLRTLIVWLSWVHEDVGHSTAAFIYDPVHTPMFVPSDGVGIPMAPLTMVTNTYRSFVFAERAALLDEPPEYWFEHKKCKKTFLFMKSCNDAVDDKACYTDFQEELRLLSTSSRIYSDCDKKGFYSCLDRVETSASS